MTVYRRLRRVVSGLVEGRKEYSRIQGAMRDLIVNAARKRAVESLLDVGCGDGGYTVENAQLLGVSRERVAGVDIFSEHLMRAQTRFHVKAVDLESEALPFEDGTFDLVICNQVLEHLKNFFWTLSEMDRVLAPGGVLAIGIPNLTSLLNRFVLVAGRQPVTIGLVGPHVRGYAHKSFCEFLQLHEGFQLEQTIGSSLYPWPARLGAESLARRLPGLSAYTFYALRKVRTVTPCPWLRFGHEGETLYRRVEQPIAEVVRAG